MLVKEGAKTMVELDLKILRISTTKETNEVSIVATIICYH